jgi:hypothetical protein
MLRRRVTPASLQGASWVLPILVAVASLVGYLGALGLRLLSTHLVANVAGAMAFAAHTQRVVAVQMIAGIAGAIVLPTVVLVAFARSRPR